MLHDENYKRLFASKLMVEHLLRACLPDDLLAAADFSELGELSTEYVSDELRKRHGDTVWRLRLGEHWGLSAVDRGAADERAGRSGCTVAGAVSARAGLLPA